MNDTRTEKEKEDQLVAEIGAWADAFNPVGRWDVSKIRMVLSRLTWQGKQVHAEFCEDPRDFRLVTKRGIRKVLEEDNAEVTEALVDQTYADLTTHLALWDVWEMAWFFGPAKVYGTDSPLELCNVDWKEVVRAGVGLICNLAGLIICIKQPEMKYEVTENNRYRLHSLTGPAFSWSDYKEYWINGVQVPEGLVTDPYSMPIETAFTEANAEVRRIYTQRVGWAHILKGRDLKVVDERERIVMVPDQKQAALKLPVKQVERLVELQLDDDDGRPAKFCHVFCPSTNREYMLRTDPTVSTIQAGLAALFGVEPENYNPGVES